jgi:TonB family protein
MAHQPMPFPLPREQQEPPPGLHSPARSFQLEEPARISLSLAENLALLREQMGTQDLDLDAFLDQIVKHARALTGSNGAAVALRHGVVILCRARCGETSPSLGAQLDADFGISGECLRTGKALRCEDSERDLRLDPEVCRQLGLRSIAVVPIFESSTVAGILEVFASQPRAFDDHHLEILQQLAELVTTVSGRVTQENQKTTSGILGLTGEARQEIPVAEVNSYASPSRSERLRKWTAILASRKYYAAAVAIFALAGLLTILGWKPWRRTEHTVVPSTKTLPQAGTASAPATTMEAERRLNIAEPGAVGRNVAVGRNLASQPEAFPTPLDHSSRAKTEKTKAEKVALLQPVSDKVEIKNTTVAPSQSRQNHDRVEPADAAEPPAPIPLVSTTGGFGKAAVVVDSALPVMASQGVSGGALERQVQPIYPTQARTMRLQGTVVLQIVIDEVGQVRNLKTVSGDAVLAQAAIDAVRQWRYQPYRLNGQPIKMPTNITLNFTLP